MSSQNDSGYIALYPDANVEAYVRVKLNATQNSCSLAGATDEWVGITQAAQTLASGLPVTVRLRNSPGTFLMRAGGTGIAANALLYGEAATGRVDDASAGGSIGFRSMEAATAAGDVIECAPSGA
jgi:hypothetical protein